MIRMKRNDGQRRSKKERRAEKRVIKREGYNVGRRGRGRNEKEKNQ
jgi:hypothetical protein